MRLRPHPSVSFRLTAGLCAVAMLSACSSLRTEYEAPQLPVAPTWDVQADGLAVVREGRWWDQFGDAQLSALVDRVLEENADLAAAGITLRQARLSANLAASQLLPTFSGGLSSDAGGDIDGDNWDDGSSASLGASWELDLFGQLDAERDAAVWEAQATAQDLAATQLSLIGTTVSTWYLIAYAHERIAMAEQSLAYSQQVYELVQRQYEAGVISRLDVRDAEQTIASQEASLATLRQALSEARHALAALLNQQGYDGPEPDTLPTVSLPEIDAGIPASLLGRRPDLKAAELRLRSQLATTDATIASYYPDITLTGALGTVSQALIGFLGTPAVSVGASLSLPFLNPDRVRLGSQIARADYELAATQFQQTFYDALRDTADALSARQAYLERDVALRRNYEAAADAEALYERQYRAGLIPLRDWLDAQERLRTAESSLIDNRQNLVNAQISLYQALGGDAAISGRSST